MSKKIQYREKESSEWQTITPADIKAAPEKHNHTVNDINGLEIGGRNLLRNRKGAKSSKAYGLTLDFLDNEFHIYGTCTRSGAPFGLGDLFSSGSLYEPGETYTLTSYPQLPVGVYIGNNTSNGSEVMAGYLNSDKDEKSKTFTVASDSTGLGYLFAGIQPWKLEDGGKVDVTFRLKLERGTKATDWTPAPEDKADASALAKKADISTIIPSASIESSTTASQGYVAGDFLVMNGVLRRVTSPISKGSAISDSNSTATNVGNEMKGISKSLTTWETVNGWTVVHLSLGLALLTSQVSFRPSGWTEWGKGVQYSNLIAGVPWPVTVKDVIYCDAEVQHDTGNTFCDAYLNAAPTTTQFPPFYVANHANNTSLETTVTVQRVALVRV